MKYVVAAIFDSAAGVYGQPFFAASVGMALRSFQDEVNRSDERNMLNRHPEDFELYELGSFDDVNARFVVLEEPRSLLRGKDAVRAKQ